MGTSGRNFRGTSGITHRGIFGKYIFSGILLKLLAENWSRKTSEKITIEVLEEFLEILLNYFSGIILKETLKKTSWKNFRRSF